MRRLLPVLFLSVVCTTVFGQKEDSTLIKRISDEILTNGKAYENLRHLTKKIGARLAGSQGMVKSMGIKSNAGKRSRQSLDAGMYGTTLGAGW
jgi:hypothetical protein